MLESENNTGKLRVALALIASVSAILVAVIGRPSSNPHEVAKGGSESERVVRGRVLDVASLESISGAEVTFDSVSYVATTFSDVEGAFQIIIPRSTSGVGGRLGARAAGYEFFEREITLLETSERFEQVRMRPLVEHANGGPIELGGEGSLDPSDGTGTKIPEAERLGGVGMFPPSVRADLDCERWGGCYFENTDAIVVDLNDDGQRELLFCHGGASCGGFYYIYSWSTNERRWRRIGDTCASDVCSFEILNTEHLGYRDVNAGGVLLDFNGLSY